MDNAILSIRNLRVVFEDGFAALGGLVVSTTIEGVQMISGLGMCDIDDIIANATGAAVGYGLYLMLRQIRRNWRLT